MYRFDISIPAPRQPLREPSVEDRTGPSLSHGLLLSMIAIIAGDRLSTENQVFAACCEVSAWYHGQVIDELLADLEQHDPHLPYKTGRALCKTLSERSGTVHIAPPAQFIEELPLIWLAITRGNSGEVRTRLTGKHQAEIDLRVPYDCRFVEGVLVGALEAGGTADVEIVHEPCVRREPYPHCTLLVEWLE